MDEFTITWNDNMWAREQGFLDYQDYIEYLNA